MLSSKELIVIFTLANFAIVSSAGKLTTDHNVATIQQKIEKELIENVTTSNILCNQSKNVNNRECTVSLTTTDGKWTSVSMCPITLAPYTENSTIGQYYDAVALDKESVMVIWLEFTSTATVRLREIWLSGCTTPKHETQIILKGNDTNVEKYAFFGINVVPYVDTFDVLFTDRGNWDGYDFCKRSFERETGKAISKLTCIASTHKIPPNLGFHSIDAYAKSSKGYLVFLPHNGSIEGYLIDAEGNTQQLAAYRMEMYPLRRFVYSTAQNMISVCSQQPNKMNPITIIANCIQYNFNGVEKLKVNITIGDNGTINDMYNLPDGGFALITLRCPSGSCLGSDDNHYYISKIDKNGRRIGSLEIPEFKCNYNILNVDKKLKFFVNEVKELCASLMCYTVFPATREPVSENYNVTTKCFSDD